MGETMPSFGPAMRSKTVQATTTSWLVNGKRRTLSSTLELGSKFSDGPERSFQDSAEEIRLAPATFQQVSTIYASLDQENEEIRLVHLFPGCDAKPIRCTLMPVKVEDLSHHPYEALSYTWGSPSNTGRIILNGADFEVTANLWSALRHLRLADSVRTLWIDAICINQQSIPERNSQVQKMGRIYRLASVVVIWLGEEENNSAAAFDFLRNPTMTTQECSADTEEEVPSTDTESRDVTPHSAWRALTALSSREYWSRVWIIQEVLCSSQAIICCGKESISMSQFTELRQICAASKLSDVAASYYSYHETTPASRLDQQRLSMKSGRSLLQLLEASKSSRSTEKRDRIFGLLGLANDDFLSESAEDSLIVDYEMSFLELFYQTIKLHALEDRVRVCQLLQCILEPEECFSRASEHVFGHPHTHLLFIEATGYRVGTVETVIAVDPSSISVRTYRSFNFEASWIRFRETLLEGFPQHEEEGKKLFAEMQRLGNSHRSSFISITGHRLLSRDNESHGIGGKRRPGRIREDPSHDFEREVGKQIEEEDFKLFLTGDGLLGCGPNSVQPGDVLYVFRGSSAVFVLNQTGAGNDSCAIRRGFAFPLYEKISTGWARSKRTPGHRSINYEWLNTWVSKKTLGDAMTFNLSLRSWEMLTR